MSMLQRSFSLPIREKLSWNETWLAPDQGLIRCWESGRELRLKDPTLSQRAEQGELVILDWRGGVERKLKSATVTGTLNYLATWQGLRGEDLKIPRVEPLTIVCARTGQAVRFSAEVPSDPQTDNTLE